MTQRRNKITDEELDAFNKFKHDVQKVMPHMVDLAQTAKALHKNMIDAPVWTIADTPRPETVEKPKLWTVGHAQVNYVDHIKTEGTQDK